MPIKSIIALILDLHICNANTHTDHYITRDVSVMKPLYYIYPKCSVCVRMDTCSTTMHGNSDHSRYS